MVEVFITDIDNARQAQRTTILIESRFAALRFHVDMDGSQAGVEFPCRHTVLGAEGRSIDVNGLMAAVKQLGYKGEVLADKICK